MGFSRRGSRTRVSNLVSVKFLPLSCAEGKALGNGTPIAWLGTGSLPVTLAFNSLTPAPVTIAAFVTAHYTAGMWKPIDLSQRDRQKSEGTKEGRKCCTL